MDRRTREIVRHYRECLLTLSEIGALYGISGERVRQIVKASGCLSTVRRVSLSESRRRSESMRRHVAKHPPQPLPHTVLAVELVRSGATFGEAAKKVGISRSAVAGACHRASVRGPGGIVTDEMRRATSERMKALWAEVRAHEAKYNPKGQSK